MNQQTKSSSEEHLLIQSNSSFAEKLGNHIGTIYSECYSDTTRKISVALLIFSSMLLLQSAGWIEIKSNDIPIPETPLTISIKGNIHIIILAISIYLFTLYLGRAFSEWSHWKTKAFTVATRIEEWRNIYAFQLKIRDDTLKKIETRLKKIDNDNSLLQVTENPHAKELYRLLQEYEQASESKLREAIQIGIQEQRIKMNEWGDKEHAMFTSQIASIKNQLEEIDQEKNTLSSDEKFFAMQFQLQLLDDYYGRAATLAAHRNRFEAIFPLGFSLLSIVRSIYSFV